MSKIVVVKREEPIRNVTFTKCQKNQAAHIGGYALDGCQEFVPSGAQGTEAALTCAGCGCNRTYHKIEVVLTRPTPPANGS